MQSRVSPFANRRRRSSGDDSRDDSSGVSSSLRQGSEGGSEQVSSWSNFKKFLQQQFKALSLVKTSPEGLHGCVAFEVEWANVRGINYLNELLVSLGQDLALLCTFGATLGYELQPSC